MEGAERSVMEKRKVLIADDMPTVLDQAKRAVGEKYQIITAASGAQVMEIARGNQLDLIIVDLQMPEMDGFTCLTRLKADWKTRDVPVIISATDLSAVMEIKGFSLDAADFIRKPYTEEILTVRIETQLKLQEYGKLRKETKEERAT